MFHEVHVCHSCCAQLTPGRSLGMLTSSPQQDPKHLSVFGSQGSSISAQPNATQRTQRDATQLRTHLPPNSSTLYCTNYYSVSYSLTHSHSSNPTYLIPYRSIPPPHPLWTPLTPLTPPGPLVYCPPSPVCTVTPQSEPTARFPTQ